MVAKAIKLSILPSCFHNVRCNFMFNLSGKTALVTGASGGIGGAIARALHGAGAHVVLSGTREAALASLAAELGARAGLIVCDLADPAVDGLVAQAEESA